MPSKPHRLWTVIAAVLLSWPLTVASAAQRTIQVGPLSREFRLYVAPSVRGPAPLVIVLHGGGGTAAQTERFTGFNQTAFRERWSVAYPQGINNHWSDGRPHSDPRRQSIPGQDDRAFIFALIEALTQEGLADPARIYLSGISNGGMMTLFAACQRPELFAGIAVIAASLPVDSACAPSLPLSAVFFHGTDDEFIPFGGGSVAAGKTRHDLGRVKGALDTVEEVARASRCRAARTKPLLIDKDPRDGTSVTMADWSCPPGIGVRHVVIIGGGHTWFGNGQRMMANWLLGRAGNEISVNEEMIRFFNGLPPRPR